jgi:hypothetical protein
MTVPAPGLPGFDTRFQLTDFRDLFLPRPRRQRWRFVRLLLDMAASAYGSRTAPGDGADGIDDESLRRTVAGGAGLIRASAAGSVAFIGPNGPAFPSLFIATAVGVCRSAR